MTLVIILAMTAVLFALAFMTKRRFGVLGLALSGGLVLAGALAGAGNVLSSLGLVIHGIDPDILARCLLILLPSLILMLGGPSYAHGIMRIFGSSLYALFATVLVLIPLEDALNLDATGERIMQAIQSSNALILLALVILALVDVLLSRTHRPVKGKKH